MDLIKDYNGGVHETTGGSVQLGSLSVTPDGVHSLTFSYGISAKDVTLVPEKDRQLLGKGAGGFVWRAIHKSTGNAVAVKEVRITSPQREKEIKLELEALLGEDSNRPHVNRVSETPSGSSSGSSNNNNSGGSPIMGRSPHIVDFFGAFYHEGSVFMVLECMDGSLDRLPFPAPPPILASIARQIVLGLRYLHEERHVIHRDIKLSNVLFYQTGQVKLSDFGISSHLAGNEDNTHTFVGTLTYMSPERLKGEEHSYAADIWSLGLITAEMALGANPYQPLFQKGDTKYSSCSSSPRCRRTTEQLFWKLLQHLSEENLDPVVELPPTMDPHLVQFIEACLQKDPAKRPKCEALLQHPFLDLVQPEEEDPTRFQEWIAQHFLCSSGEAPSSSSPPSAPQGSLLPQCWKTSRFNGSFGDGDSEDTSTASGEESTPLAAPPPPAPARRGQHLSVEEDAGEAESRCRPIRGLKRINVSQDGSGGGGGGGNRGDTGESPQCPTHLPLPGEVHHRGCEVPPRPFSTPPGKTPCSNTGEMCRSSGSPSHSSPLSSPPFSSQFLHQKEEMRRKELRCPFFRNLSRPNRSPPPSSSCDTISRTPSPQRKNGMNADMEPITPYTERGDGLHPSSLLPPYRGTFHLNVEVSHPRDDGVFSHGKEKRHPEIDSACNEVRTKGGLDTPLEWEGLDLDEVLQHLVEPRARRLSCETFLKNNEIKEGMGEMVE